MIKNKASRRTSGTAGVPVHEQVYRTLRSQILFGEMAPGQPVTIQGLTDSLGVGMTPVREAIRRLISAGALEFHGNRRVSVPVLTRADLDQINFVRKSIEPELARLAVEKITPEIIAELTQIDTKLDAAIAAGDIGAYLKQNYKFHACLNAVAQAPVLEEITDRLWLRFGPSLRVVCGRFGTGNLPDEHKSILSALAKRDADTVASAMLQDVEQGLEMIRSVLIETPEPV